MSAYALRLVARGAHERVRQLAFGRRVATEIVARSASNCNSGRSLAPGCTDVRAVKSYGLRTLRALRALGRKAFADWPNPQNSEAYLVKPTSERRFTRARLRELLVLLKGNDVWVYATEHTKYFPESYDVQPKRDVSKMQMQTVIAFGPPGESGEDTLSVPVDHGQPWLYDPTAPVSWP